MIVVDRKDDRSERVTYDYPDYPVQINKLLLSDYPGYAADIHWHEDIEMISVLSGWMDYSDNGTVTRLHAGEGIVVNAKQLHYGFSAERSECEFICILFHPLLLCATHQMERDYVMPVLSSGIPCWLLSAGTDWQARILGIMRAVLDAKYEPDAPLIVQEQLFRLWHALYRNAGVDGGKSRVSDTRLSVLKDMIAYIHGHYNEKISLSDIAASGHVSRRTCGTLFLEYRNKTPMEFLTDYRLRRSIELLKSTDATILEISLASGFSGASYYAETFRRQFGVSPGAYRRGAEQ